ncbi:MAG: hypothetical protein ACKOAR_13905 [Bacteroidota bacterium]
MTSRQINSLRKKIDQIKKALAADKKRGGGYYDDSRGLRYMPPGLFLRLQDYAEWLSRFVTSKKFYTYANEFIENEKASGQSRWAR